MTAVDVDARKETCEWHFVPPVSTVSLMRYPKGRCFSTGWHACTVDANRSLCSWDQQRRQKDQKAKGSCRRLPTDQINRDKSDIAESQNRFTVCGSNLLYLHINSRLPSVNHALISSILPHPVVWVALPPSGPSTHHSHHPSPLHSFTPGLKLSFSANPSHRSLPFLLLDWLHGFPGLFTDTSEHIRFFSPLFLFSTVSCFRAVD